MKKLIILGLLFVLLVIGVFIGVQYINQKNITFTFDANDYSVAIKDDSSNIIRELKSSSSVRLNEGAYSYQVIGNDFNSEDVSFVVDDNKEILVKSEYTSEKMFTLLNQENTQIRTLLLNAYSSKSEFEIQDTKLHERGEWASALLVVTLPQQPPVAYRTVLKKENNTWKIVIKPTIAINAADHKDVPAEILSSLYED